MREDDEASLPSFAHPVETGELSSVFVYEHYSSAKADPVLHN
jgi:hypothetical protein